MAAVTASPLLFIKVVGFMIRQRFPDITASHVSDLNFSFLQLSLYFSHRVSITIKPMLWRVLSYWVPGLPRPQIIYSTAPDGTLDRSDSSFLKISNTDIFIIVLPLGGASLLSSFVWFCGAGFLSKFKGKQNFFNRNFKTHKTPADFCASCNFVYYFNIKIHFCQWSLKKYISACILRIECICKHYS